MMAELKTMSTHKALHLECGFLTLVAMSLDEYQPTL
jgi:hypothetical protein